MDAGSEVVSVASVMEALKELNPDLLNWLREKFATESDIYNFLTTLKGGRDSDHPQSAAQLVVSNDPGHKASAMAMIRWNRESEYKKDMAEAARRTQLGS